MTKKQTNDSVNKAVEITVGCLIATAVIGSIGYMAGYFVAEKKLKPQLHDAIYQQTAVDNFIQACDGGTVTITVYSSGLAYVKTEAPGCKEMTIMLHNYGTNRVEIRNGSDWALVLRRKRIREEFVAKPPSILSQGASK